jgi:hypothetical protein
MMTRVRVRMQSGKEGERVDSNGMEGYPPPPPPSSLATRVIYHIPAAIDQDIHCLGQVLNDIAVYCAQMGL